MKTLLTQSLIYFCALWVARAAEPPAGPVLRIEAGMHVSAVETFVSDEAGRLVLTCSRDKTGRLWDVASGRLLRVLRPPIVADGGYDGYLYACALTRDGSVAVLSETHQPNSDFAEVRESREWRYSTYFFDTASGRMLRRLPVEGAVRELAFSPDGRFLAAAMELGMLRIWEVSSGREVFHDGTYADGNLEFGEFVDWCEDRILTCVDHAVRVYKMSNGKVSLLASRKMPQGVKLGRFSPGASRIAIIAQNTVEVVDGNKLTGLFTPVNNIAILRVSSVAWSNDGADLCAILEQNNLTLEGRERGVLRKWSQAGRGSPVDTSCSMGNYRPLPDGSFLYANRVELGILKAGGKLELLAPSPVGAYVGHPAVPVRLDYSDGVIIKILDEELQNKGLKVSTMGWNWDGRLKFYNSENRLLLSFYVHADGRRWILWTPEGYYDCAPGAENLLGWHVNRGHDQPADFFSASRFRNIYYRPDVVKRTLQTLDVSKALQQANRALGKPEAAPEQISKVITQLAPPVVELETGGLIGTVSLPAEATYAKIRYRVRQTGAEPTTKVSVRFNGRLLDLAAPLPKAGETAEVTVPLPLGMSGELSVIAEHRLAASEAAVLRVERQPGQPSPRRPNLYVVAVGVADLAMNDAADLNHDGKATIEEIERSGLFKEGELVLPDLDHAGDDARQIANVFNRQKGRLYEQVVTKLLLDREATAPAIRQALRSVAGLARPEDVAVFFFSGHGIADARAGFYLATHEADPKKPGATAILGAELATLLEAIQARTVLALDTCHSGGAFGGARLAKVITSPQDLTGLVNQLSSAEQGTVVFSSSAASEQSLEDPSKGGVFTQALREGLVAKGVTCLSMQTWLTQRVPELVAALVKGIAGAPQQTPACVIPKGVPDFPLAMP